MISKKFTTLYQTVYHVLFHLQDIDTVFAADRCLRSAQDPNLPQGAERPADGQAALGESSAVADVANEARAGGNDTPEDAVASHQRRLDEDTCARIHSFFTLVPLAFRRACAAAR